MKNKEPKASVRRNKPKIRLSYLGKSLLVRGENKRKFEELRVKVLKEIVPSTEIENILCDKFIFSAWRHRRIVEIERNILSSRNTPEINKLTQEEEDAEIIDRQFDWDPIKSGAELKKRVRNIKKLKLDDPEMQSLLRHEIAMQKNMLKILERIREEQKLRKGIVRSRVG